MKCILENFPYQTILVFGLVSNRDGAGRKAHSNCSCNPHELLVLRGPFYVDLDL